ncbi:MAG: hypothetical protein K6E68_00230 [Lachnospiraceae bacterium]|nr:hypothetical protein [Lachnospiraceae bacterium]
MRSAHKIIIPIFLISLMVCAGCGKKNSKELDAYYDSMNRFATGMAKIAADLEAVDTSVPGASNEVLGYLDKINEQLATLAEIEVPDEFASNEELADEAYEYMQQAVSLFHQYYEDPDCERAVFEVATENYSRAMKRVNYISYILKGELPEGSDYEVIENNTDFAPVTDGNEPVMDEYSDDMIMDDESEEILE